MSNRSNALSHLFLKDSSCYSFLPVPIWGGGVGRPQGLAVACCSQPKAKEPHFFLPWKQNEELLK